MVAALGKFGKQNNHSEHFLVTHVTVFSPMCLSLLEHTFSFLSNFSGSFVMGSMDFCFCSANL
jgi:hypothetical protein